MRFFAVLVATTHALHAVPPQNRRHGVVCHGKKTNALLGALRRVPLVKRVVPQKKHAPRTPPPPETSVEAAPEIAELIDAEAVKAEKVLEAVVQQVVERGVAVPYEKPVEPELKPEQPEESQIERFDRLHASPLDRTDELLKGLRDASRSCVNNSSVRSSGEACNRSNLSIWLSSGCSGFGSGSTGFSYGTATPRSTTCWTTASSTFAASSASASISSAISGAASTDVSGGGGVRGSCFFCGTTRFTSGTLLKAPRRAFVFLP